MTRKNQKKQDSKSKDQAPPSLPPADTNTDLILVPESQDGFPIVGIGASAGGLAAFEEFFSGMPADKEPGMAFVLVQHLAPDHKSLLTDLIQRHTRMKVFEVEDGMVVRPNCAYIIPPGHDMAFLNGALHLLEPQKPRGQRLPIDFFFRSLAQDQHERAIGIVLTGSGSDGTQGVRAIKGEGGMVMAQEPSSTAFDSMPRSAIATGLVDYTCLPAEMPARLIAYARHAFGKTAAVSSTPAQRIESAMKKIFIILRAGTGHDFSLYKPSTIHRRIDRRMAVHQIKSMGDYVRFLQQSPDEVVALFQDLLIGVTNFFRDPDAFRALEQQAIPKLFEKKSQDAVIRVWVPGCSTGEEAYSIAILLVERMEAMKQKFTVQIFATDIDSRSIDTARAGVYPAGIAADLSPARLARFFTAGPDGSTYRIQKNVRDLLVFSEQDLIKDPPFSKLDLISCRNLLIYLSAELQKKLIPLFHYSLKPGGILFLGTSEGVGEFGELFAPLDRKSKLYLRKEEHLGLQRPALSRFLPPMTTLTESHPAVKVKAPDEPKPSLRKLTEDAILHLATPAAALVHGNGDVLYLHGRTGMFLEPAPGDAGTNNILKMARDGLRHALLATLRKAAETHNCEFCPGLRVKTNGHHTLMDLTIRPVTDGPLANAEDPLFLVIVQKSTSGDSITDRHAPEAQDDGDAEAHIVGLRQELRAKDEYLQSTLEELETANEELKSSNEEMQSVNEELQSTNEELETSKEELQSVNEELTTVNGELQVKVLDLSRANNDMNNLLAGTGIATVFVDHQLRILRFTPAASQIINLIPADVGRPVGHIVSNLVGYDLMLQDTQAVLETLVAKSIDVKSEDGKWYTMRIQPYRTLDNVIEGAVISFVEITEMMEAKNALQAANEQLQRLAVVVRDASDAITVQDLDGRILAWNPGAERLYGWSEEEALTMNARDLTPEKLQEKALARLQLLCNDKMLKPYNTERVSKNGRTVRVTVISTPLINAQGEMYAISTTERAMETGPPTD